MSESESSAPPTSPKPGPSKTTLESAPLETASPSGGSGPPPSTSATGPQPEAPTPKTPEPPSIQTEAPAVSTTPKAAPRVFLSPYPSPNGNTGSGIQARNKRRNLAEGEFQNEKSSKTDTRQWAPPLTAVEKLPKRGMHLQRAAARSQASTSKLSTPSTPRASPAGQAHSTEGHQRMLPVQPQPPNRPPVPDSSPPATHPELAVQQRQPPAKQNHLPVQQVQRLPPQGTPTQSQPLAYPRQPAQQVGPRGPSGAFPHQEVQPPVPYGGPTNQQGCPPAPYGDQQVQRSSLYGAPQNQQEHPPAQHSVPQQQPQPAPPLAPYGAPQDQQVPPLAPYGAPQDQQARPPAPYGAPQDQQVPPLAPYGAPQDQQARPPAPYGAPQDRQVPPLAPYGAPQDQQARPPAPYGAPQDQQAHPPAPYGAFHTQQGPPNLYGAPPHQQQPPPPPPAPYGAAQNQHVYPPAPYSDQHAQPPAPYGPAAQTQQVHPPAPYSDQQAQHPAPYGPAAQTQQVHPPAPYGVPQPQRGHPPAPYGAAQTQAHPAALYGQQMQTPGPYGAPPTSQQQVQPPVPQAHPAPQAHPPIPLYGARTPQHAPHPRASQHEPEHQPELGQQPQRPLQHGQQLGHSAQPPPPPRPAPQGQMQQYYDQPVFPRDHLHGQQQPVAQQDLPPPGPQSYGSAQQGMIDKPATTESHSVPAKRTSLVIRIPARRGINSSEKRRGAPYHVEQRTRRKKKAAPADVEDAIMGEADDRERDDGVNGYTTRLNPDEDFGEVDNSEDADDEGGQDRMQDDDMYQADQESNFDPEFDEYLETLITKDQADARSVQDDMDEQDRGYSRYAPRPASGETYAQFPTSSENVIFRCGDSGKSDGIEGDEQRGVVQRVCTLDDEGDGAARHINRRGRDCNGGVAQLARHGAEWCSASAPSWTDADERRRRARRDAAHQSTRTRLQRRRGAAGTARRGVVQCVCTLDDEGDGAALHINRRGRDCNGGVAQLVRREPTGTSDDEGAAWSGATPLSPRELTGTTTRSGAVSQTNANEGRGRTRRKVVVYTLVDRRRRDCGGAIAHLLRRGPTGTSDDEGAERSGATPLSPRGSTDTTTKARHEVVQYCVCTLAD
ncbi:hypothetical protein C8Q76DRAFT_693406 [Earliella scabrosa]|nr:hypothetical protein C8Q76DRAFT_693406 [Earliella scabrosa]